MQNKRRGRLTAEVVDARENWVFSYFRKHPDTTKDALNAALVAQDHLGGMPMRPVRVYEIKRAATSGALVVPPVIAGKRASKRAGAQQSPGQGGEGAVANRASQPATDSQEQVVMDKATKLLVEAGFEDIEISYRPGKRTVTVS